MIFSMDLNASPLPEEDEQPCEEPVGVDYAHEEHVESAVATMRREREERRRKLKREQQDEGPRLYSQQIRNDYAPPTKVGRGRIKEAPQGWLDCPAFGEPIDKIIPSKVPLDETFNDSVPPGKRYSSKQVVNKQRKAGRDIGLVIDLTNTSRYYSPSEWTKQGTKHVKIPCKGRDAVPDNESVNVFVYEVMMFLDRQKHSKSPKYILVHCTHGHNRTGFMIIHYDDNGDLAPAHNEVQEKVITNDDVLGDAVPYDQQDALRLVCYRLLELPLVCKGLYSAYE